MEPAMKCAHGYILTMAQGWVAMQARIPSISPSCSAVFRQLLNHIAVQYSSHFAIFYCCIRRYETVGARCFDKRQRAECPVCADTETTRHAQDSIASRRHVKRLLDNWVSASVASKPDVLEEVREDVVCYDLTERD
jgi:hypothetical protein